MQTVLNKTSNEQVLQKMRDVVQVPQDPPNQGHLVKQ